MGISLIRIRATVIEYLTQQVGINRPCGGSRALVHSADQRVRWLSQGAERDPVQDPERGPRMDAGNHSGNQQGRASSCHLVKMKLAHPGSLSQGFPIENLNFKARARGRPTSGEPRKALIFPSVNPKNKLWIDVSTIRFKNSPIRFFKF